MSTLAAAVGLADVLPPVPGHPVPGQAVAHRKERVARGVLPRGRGRIHEKLNRKGCPVVASAARDDRRKRPADAVAPDTHPVDVDPELGSVLHHPARGGPAIVERRGIRMLRREPVVDRHHDARCPLRERARRAVVRLDASDDIAAAVEVHERAHRLARLDRAVDPNRDAVGVAILDRVAPRRPARTAPSRSSRISPDSLPASSSRPRRRPPPPPCAGRR